MKARIKFTKSGAMKFVGHLDIMRYFQKAFKRAEIDVEYSKGFSPHQLISFAAPLGVGLTSEAEYLDMQLGECLSSKEMIDKINLAMVDGIEVVSFRTLSEESKNAMSIVAAADYSVTVKDGYDICENYREKLTEFLNQEEIIILKKTKKSEKEVDIKQFIYAFAFDRKEFEEKINYNGEQDNHHLDTDLVNRQEAPTSQKDVLYLQVATGSANNLKPELVMQAFCEWVGVPYNPFAYQVHRIEIYGDMDNSDKLKLISLEDLGTEF